MIDQIPKATDTPNSLDLKSHERQTLHDLTMTYTESCKDAEVLAYILNKLRELNFSDAFFACVYHT